MIRTKLQTFNGIEVESPSVSFGLSIYWLKGADSDRMRETIEQVLMDASKKGLRPIGKYYRFNNMLNILFRGNDVNRFAEFLFEQDVSNFLIDLIYQNEDGEVMSVEISKDKNKTIIPKTLKDSQTIKSRWLNWFNQYQ